MVLTSPWVLRMDGCGSEQLNGANESVQEKEGTDNDKSKAANRKEAVLMIVVSYRVNDQSYGDWYLLSCDGVVSC